MTQVLISETHTHARSVKRDEGRRLNVSRVLKVLDVSRSNYYASAKRGQEVNPQKERKQQLVQEIHQIHEDSRRIYGAPKITHELKKKGWTVAEKTVGNYMREEGLRPHYQRPYTRTTDSGPFDETLRNLLNESFQVSDPNTVWCSDITYIGTDSGFCYLTTIMDLYSRRILSWRLSTTLEAKWVVECVREAQVKRRGARPRILHSDRGTQYISAAYLQALGDIEASYSYKASPWQNACIESFHALIKREWLYSHKIQDHKHAYRLVFEYIEAFYNTVRSHSHCSYLSPMEYEINYKPKQAADEITAA